MKFLLVGAGRRNQLAKLMKEKGVIVHSYELFTNSPIQLNSDKVIQGKKWTDNNITSHILELSNDYDLIIPLMDEATNVVSKLSLFNSCVSDQETTELCLNKKKFQEFFTSDHELSELYPVVGDGKVVLKPIYGHSSAGIIFTERLPRNISGYIAQQKVVGKEYSIDCFYDLNSQLIDFVPRERLKVANGEVLESITVEKNKFETIVNLISNKIKFKGPICMQFIEDENGKIWIIEINARLGGGATLSIGSGFDMVKLMIDCFCNKNFNFENYISSWKVDYKLIRYTLDYLYEN